MATVLVLLLFIWLPVTTLFSAIGSFGFYRVFKVSPRAVDNPSYARNNACALGLGNMILSLLPLLLTASSTANQVALCCFCGGVLFAYAVLGMTIGADFQTQSRARSEDERV
ncbi:MAG: hypothetical protein K2W82_15590 [Candidatus Obscuribacterales bacterium]|nr:hypothetical protein [Candidatus Obscuribacterales bacterium]